MTGGLRLHGMNWQELNEINEVLSSSMQILRICKAGVSQSDHYMDISKNA